MAAEYLDLQNITVPYTPSYDKAYRERRIASPAFEHIKIPNRLFPKDISTFPISEINLSDKSSQLRSRFPGLPRGKALDTLFCDTLGRINPIFLRKKMPTKKILSALKSNPELMDKFIQELLAHGDIEVACPSHNRILDLIISHPNTTVKCTPYAMIIGLREGYLFKGDSFLPTITSLQKNGQLIENTLTFFPHPFSYQGKNIIEETIMEKGMEIKRWSIPLTFEEAKIISKIYQQRVE